jgi:transcriptional regulator with XRE-family HTH domain
MPGVRRPTIAFEARRASREQLAAVGSRVRSARHRRRWTQAQLGLKAGVSRMLVSRLERGLGGGVTLDALQRVALGLGVRLRVDLARDPQEDPADAGHLAIQELVTRRFRAMGWRRFVELPTRPAQPWRSGDVVGVDDRHGHIVIVECWNTIGDIGMAVRSSNRKQVDGEALATARWGERPSSVHLLWVVRQTARNRELLRRYPEFFRARFPASSAAWSKFLDGSGKPPEEAGIVWSDLTGQQTFAWRPRRDRVGH